MHGIMRSKPYYSYLAVCDMEFQKVLEECMKPYERSESNRKPMTSEELLTIIQTDIRYKPMP